MSGQFVVRHPNFNHYLRLFPAPKHVTYFYDDVTEIVKTTKHEWVNEKNLATPFTSLEEARANYTSPLCDIVPL